MNTSHQANLSRIEATYGVKSSDSFDGDIAALHSQERQTMDLVAFLAEGGKFSRIRLITEGGYPFMDISYVYGNIGCREIRVVGIDQYKLGRRTYRSQIAAQIKNAGGNRAQQQQAWATDSYAILWG
jgi:hypothetical protein